nr:MAG TPA: hypothetical protein [Caudoviricetes sp.]
MPETVLITNLILAVILMLLDRSVAEVILLQVRAYLNLAARYECTHQITHPLSRI